MPSFEIICKNKVQEYIGKENRFDFPTFMRLIRSALGLSRRDVAININIHPMRIYTLECGSFHRKPSEDYLIAISDFYGIPYALIQKKVDQFLNEKNKVFLKNNKSRPKDNYDKFYKRTS